MTARDPDAIRQLFDDISPTYDRLNRLLSLGQDQLWRREAARCVEAGPGDVLLDLCGGTGDLALALAGAHPKARVLLVDFAEQMLRLAQAKATATAQGSGPCAKVDPVLADALALPLANGSCRGATVGFGIRNLSDVRAGLGEVHRVLRPGGRLAILEFMRPTGAGASLRAKALMGFVPLVTRLVAPSRLPAYVYLAGSILEFLSVDEMTLLLREVGFGEVSVRGKLFGIAVIMGATRL